MKRLKQSLFLSLACALPLAACGDDGGATPDVDARPIPDANIAPDGAVVLCEPTPGTAIRMEELARGLSDPLYAIAPPLDERIFVVEQGGRIKIIQDNQVLATPFLELPPTLVRDIGNEQGLLGLAFHPDYENNGRFFVTYTSQAVGDVSSGATVVAEYTVSDDPNVANTAGKVLLAVDQPFSNHNGGGVEFGPDGYLYVSIGDGGFRDDPDNNGENPNTLLGTLIRIDVDNGDPYSVPADNPFVGGGGAPEVFHYGLRNPWRFSFDPATGDLYIADVGQDAFEEVDVVAGSDKGLNFGWNEFEGMSCFDGPCDETGKTAPAHVYPHVGNNRCSVTGGFVYRGECMPDLNGWYFFGDFCGNEIFKFEYANGSVTNIEDLTSTLDPGGDIREGLTSFGKDGIGEILVVSRAGKVWRIVPDI